MSTSSTSTPPSWPPPTCPTRRCSTCCRRAYCQSDELCPVRVRAVRQPSSPAGAACRPISNWVHEHLGFDYGAASPIDTAVDVLRDGHGVCRDFTHLAIALCRALNVPSRYVFGYLPDIDVPDPGTPMDFCAWMEVWLGDRWYTFDPRNDQHRIGRTVIGRGRDAADVAMVTTFGPSTLRLDDRHRRGGALTWRSRSCWTTASSCSTTATSTSPRPARRRTSSATR